jgi:hypothetical protein
MQVWVQIESEIFLKMPKNKLLQLFLLIKLMQLEGKDKINLVVPTIKEPIH